LVIAVGELSAHRCAIAQFFGRSDRNNPKFNFFLKNELLVKQIHVNNPFFPRLLLWRRNMSHNFLRRGTAATMASWGLASPGPVKKEIHVVIKPKKARGYVQILEPDKVMELAS
jgi:hypothetical protein